MHFLKVLKYNIIYTKTFICDHIWEARHYINNIILQILNALIILLLISFILEYHHYSKLN